MEIKIEASIGMCSEFISDDNKKSQVSIIIAPLHIYTNEEGDRVQINMGCNMWRMCQNIKCYYSIASRQTKKA